MTRGSGIRWTLLTLTILLMALTVPTRMVEGQGDDLTIIFDLSLDSTGSGSIHLYIGTAVTEDLVVSELVVKDDYGSHDNQNLIRVMNSLDEHMNSPEEVFRAVLDTDSNVVLEDFVYRATNGTGIYAISFDMSFSLNDSSDRVEYHYLDFLKDIPLPKAEEGDKYAENWRDREIAQIRSCKVHIDIDLDPAISLDLQDEGGDHTRTPGGESLERERDLYDLISRGNGMIVYDCPIISPLWLFVITIFVTVASYVGLGLIWWKNLFRGPGLILPILTIIFSLSPLLIYHNPHLNAYSMMDLFLFSSYAVNTLLLVGCYFVNPRKEEVTTYEEEKGPSFEMPKVVYMEKNVYIRQEGHSGIDPYDVLGVTRSMSMDEITERYKKDILRFHPDKFANMSERIQEISARETERLNQAYEFISKERSD